jgi:hypothetical protein
MAANLARLGTGQTPYALRRLTVAATGDAYWQVSCVRIAAPGTIQRLRWHQARTGPWLSAPRFDAYYSRSTPLLFVLAGV